MYGDSLWNGLAIGAGIGAGAALISDPHYRPCTNDRAARCADAQIPQRLLAVGAMAAAGAGIDALYRRRHPVYVAPDEASTGAVRIIILPAPGRFGLGLSVDVDLALR